MQWGTRIQQAGANVLQKAPQQITDLDLQPINLLRSPMATPSSKPLPHILPQYSENEALMILPEGEIEKTVFYFPGCGSERLYSEIAMASIYLLAKCKTRVIIPPSYLCCGFPAKVNAKKKMAANIALRDTIILTQIKEMLGHIVFDRFLISCGTCRESLHEMGCEDIFNCKLEDISHFILEESAWDYSHKKMAPIFYHTPCHDSCDGEGAPLLGRLYDEVEPVPNCCSEAGTLAISRPDISFAMRNRKRHSFEEKGTTNKTTVVATNCPSCISGLNRNSDLGIQPVHMAVLLAESLGGENWRDKFTTLVAKSEKVTF